MDAMKANGSALRLASRLFALAVAVAGLGCAATAWWWLDGPGSPCRAFRSDPSTVCRSELWMFPPPIAPVAIGLGALFLACLLAARVWRARTGRS